MYFRAERKIFFCFKNRIVLPYSFLTKTIHQHRKICSLQKLQHCNSLLALLQPAGTAATCMHCSSLKALLQPDGTAATCMHCSSLQALQQPACTAAV